jgi:hypothetical protein
MPDHIVIYTRAIPAGTYGQNESIPILPRKVRQMSRRRQKIWLRRKIEKALKR